MKIKATKDYVDRHKEEICFAGSIYDYEPERAKAIIDAGYAKKVPEEGKEKPAVKK